MTTVRKLPFWRSIGESFRLTAHNAGFLVRIGWPWIVLAGVLGALIPALFAWVPDADGDWSIKSSVEWVLESVCRMMCLAAIAVPWHRYLLLQDGNANAAPVRLMIIYGAYAAALELAALLGFVLFPAVTAMAWPTSLSAIVGWSLIAVVLPIASLYVWGRLFLVLPALALGRDASFAASWRGTTGNGWRIFWATSFIFMPFLLPFLFVGGAGGAGVAGWSGSLPGWLGTAVSTAYFCLSALVGIVFLSIAYRDLVLAREP